MNISILSDVKMKTYFFYSNWDFTKDVVITLQKQLIVTHYIMMTMCLISSFIYEDLFINALVFTSLFLLFYVLLKCYLYSEGRYTWWTVTTVVSNPTSNSYSKK